MAHDRRRFVARRFDEGVQPVHRAFGVKAPVAGTRGTVGGKVGSDHPMGGHQVGDAPAPIHGRLARTVEEHQGRAIAALEDSGRNAGRVEPAFGDGHATQQPIPVLVRSG